MGPIDPAIAIIIANFPLTVVVLFCFFKRWFRLGPDVEEEIKQLREAHSVEVNLITQIKDEYKSRWEEEKRDRLALTDRITPLAETIRESAGLIERSVQISEELLDEQREAGQRTPRDQGYVRRSRGSQRPAKSD